MGLEATPIRSAHFFSTCRQSSRIEGILKQRLEDILENQTPAEDCIVPAARRTVPLNALTLGASRVPEPFCL